MSEGKAGMLAVVITGFRVLFFRATREELLRLDGRHLAYQPVENHVVTARLCD